MLTQEKVRELFDYHQDGYLVWRANRGVNKVAGKQAGSVFGRYRAVTLGGRRVLEHRLVWAWHRDAEPGQVDHINRNPRDNRIENLRAASPAENASNARKRRKATSRWKGVSYQTSKGKWRAYAAFGRDVRYLGLFAEEADAAQAYNFVAAAMQGDFAVLNSAEQTCPLLSPAL